MRIECLKIYTENLREQKRFYSEVLQMSVKQTSEEEIEIQIGFSVLKIRQKKAATPYHVAFHIPAEQENIALQWVKQRTSILKNGKDEIIDFPAWNAKSIYFYDADKNVLEFISRKHCFPSQSEEFSAKSIEGIAEIGVATNNVKKVYDFLNQKIGLEKFTGDYDRFCAMGDDEGLFIVIDKDEKDWIPTNDKAFSSEFITDVTHQNIEHKLIFENHELKERN